MIFKILIIILLLNIYTYASVVIEVPWSEIKCVNQNKALFTKGLTPCIAVIIAAQNNEKKSAVCMMHIPLPPGADANEIKKRALELNSELISEAIENLSEQGFSKTEMFSILSVEQEWRNINAISPSQKNALYIEDVLKQKKIEIKKVYIHHVAAPEGEIGSRNVKVDLQKNKITIAEDEQNKTDEKKILIEENLF